MMTGTVVPDSMIIHANATAPTSVAVGTGESASTAITAHRDLPALRARSDRGDRQDPRVFPESEARLVPKALKV